ncbi:4Fe-4S binding domain-containing protein [Mariniphaga anaerophila]|uniref:4Fe-4S binding domain-containing protein n=1 Tax=Mariniphaga anaerophila TaxID=1484053 RepID=A0A1M4TNR6_9BACT|nr:EFR1 family ferrodoxin [Mariniphaga anaerophila]SHE46016.1 4Fe-4S binding domain-containing protein [Mariniphaga anaerophila]
MKTELRYFTGTGNSLKVLKTCGEVFSESGTRINLAEISLKEKNIEPADLLVFCFPVYAFGIPRICNKYLNGIEPFKKQQNVAVLITAGDSDESGFAVKECIRVLNKKNCDVIYSGIIQMPINWTTSPKPPFPPSKESAAEIIKKGEAEARKIAKDIVSGVIRQHNFNYPKRYSRIKFYWEYWAFKYLGLPSMWRLFKVYNTCDGCGLCAKICPTNSIEIIQNKPVWSKTCEQCMRCVNFCPAESIFQSQGGETKDRHKYREPDFKPKYDKNQSHIVV